MTTGVAEELEEESLEEEDMIDQFYLQRAQLLHPILYTITFKDTLFIRISFLLLFC